MAVDKEGNIYIADEGNSRIRRIDAITNKITTIAGPGNVNSSGDDGLAINAYLSEPECIAIDDSDNIFIADPFLSRIRKIDAKTQIITTVAGNGVLDTNGDGGLATLASIGNAEAVAVDKKGNLYIAQSLDSRIRKVDATTKIITTIAGTGIYGFSGDGGLATNAKLGYPWGVTVDSSGNVFIADGYRIRKIDANTQIITTIAGTGQFGYSGDGDSATKAKFGTVWNILIDKNNDLIIADEGNNVIRKIDHKTQIISTIAGNGTAGYEGDGGSPLLAELNGAAGTAYDLQGNLLIADNANNAIRKITPSVLAISKLSFTGKLLDNNTASLMWNTRNELNVTYFEVEESSNYTSFHSVGHVAAKGEFSQPNQYTFIVRDVASNTNYFRIKIVDKDGKYTYSNIVSLRSGNASTVEIRPNPTRDYVTISFPKQSSNTQIKITDINGRIVRLIKVNPTITSLTEPVKPLTKGIYFIEIIGSNIKPTHLVIE